MAGRNGEKLILPGSCLPQTLLLIDMVSRSMITASDRALGHIGGIVIGDDQSDRNGYVSSQIPQNSGLVNAFRHRGVSLMSATRLRLQPHQSRRSSLDRVAHQVIPPVGVNLRVSGNLVDLTSKRPQCQSR